MVGSDRVNVLADGQGVKPLAEADLRPLGDRAKSSDGAQASWTVGMALQPGAVAGLVQRAVEQDGGAAAAHDLGMQRVDGSQQCCGAGLDSWPERVRQIRQLDQRRRFVDQHGRQTSKTARWSLQRTCQRQPVARVAGQAEVGQDVPASHAPRATRSDWQ